MGEAFLDLYHEFKNTTDWMKFMTDSDAELFRIVLEQNNTGRNQSYETLSPSQCIRRYNNDFVSNSSNLFLIAQNNLITNHNSTILHISQVGGNMTTPSRWMCATHWYSGYWDEGWPPCDLNKIAPDVTGFPWLMNPTTYGGVEISQCKIEKTAENCKVQFSLGIMIVVICYILVKACSMAMAVVRSREPTLVTLGDAVDSFSRTPDPTTVGICFVDRGFVQREWTRWWRAVPRQWKQKGVRRWWTSVSKTRWMTCNIFCLITIITAGVLLRRGIINDGNYLDTSFKSMYDTPSLCH
ncbi:hypothetical protein HOY82DRAFT_542268 [Tuber indicum]|nr:hypothetical protein HOY82DRAFT_542268 [Tuber indicum]